MSVRSWTYDPVTGQLLDSKTGEVKPVEPYKQPSHSMYDGNRYSPPPYGQTTYQHRTWQSTIPYADIDRAKWPNTWATLVMLYHGTDWYRITKYSSEPVTKQEQISMYYGGAYDGD